MPYAGLDDLMKMPEAERKAQEKQMQAEWTVWMTAHAGAITESAGVGKPKRLTKEGAEDSRNDIMMYSFLEADIYRCRY